jgi:hypothetical protein
MPEDTPNTREPESLLTNVNHSIFFKGLLISAAVHIAFLGLTSFGLYRDWAEYGFRSEIGFHTPSNIQRLQRDRAREREAAERERREEERRADRAARALEDEERREREADAAPARATPQTPAEPEIEPLPPRPFSLDDLPDLDI